MRRLRLLLLAQEAVAKAAASRHGSLRVARTIYAQADRDARAAWRQLRQPLEQRRAPRGGRETASPADGAWAARDRQKQVLQWQRRQQERQAWAMTQRRQQERQAWAMTQQRQQQLRHEPAWQSRRVETLCQHAQHGEASTATGHSQKAQGSFRCRLHLHLHPHPHPALQQPPTRHRHPQPPPRSEQPKQPQRRVRSGWQQPQLPEPRGAPFSQVSA